MNVGDLHGRYGDMQARESLGVGSWEDSLPPRLTIPGPASPRSLRRQPAPGLYRLRERASARQHVAPSATTSRTTSRSSITCIERQSAPLAAHRSTRLARTDQANHQYDISDFFTALKGGNLPAVSFLKAPAWADGHAGYSDPLDEQTFVVNTINAIMASDEWKETAIIIAYDDSDGWYDHSMDPVVNQSGRDGAAVDSDDALSTQNTAKPATSASARRRQPDPLQTSGPLRPWPAPALAGDLTLREGKLRGPPDHRPVLDPPFHRGQLGPRPPRWRLERLQGWETRRHV